MKNALAPAAGSCTPRASASPAMYVRMRTAHTSSVIQQQCKVDRLNRIKGKSRSIE